MYALTIFAKRRGDKGKFQAVYTYVIKVTSPMENCVEFPAVTSAWSGGVDNEILEPLGGTLLARETVDFAIKMPKGKVDPSGRLLTSSENFRRRFVRDYVEHQCRTLIWKLSCMRRVCVMYPFVLCIHKDRLVQLTRCSVLQP